MTKHIYACGCSWTMKDWKQDGRGARGWPMWPELLANELGLPCVNEALSAAGNDYILNTSVQHILDNHENLELVVIGWSQALRMWLWDDEFFNAISWLKTAKHHEGMFPMHDKDHWEFTFFPDPYETARHFIKYFSKKGLGHTLGKRFVRQVYTLQRLCEELNVKYIFTHALPPMVFDYIQANSDVDIDIEHELREFMSVPLFHKIDRKHFVGWPGQYQLGGGSVFELVQANPEDHEVGYIDLHPTRWDSHPNEKGQKLIADLYIQKYKELYS